MHKLTQAVLRDRLTSAEAAATRARTEAILAANDPGDPDEPVSWPQWARLMPHLLAADLAATDSPGLRQLTCSACSYLISRGDARTCHDLASGLRQQWRDRRGDDHEQVLVMTRYLGWALSRMGRYAEARNLHRDTLDRHRRILGPDHAETLFTANNLAADLRGLGDAHAARDLARDTLSRRRRILGPDHPETLFSAQELASCLGATGEIEAARDLDQDTLDRRRWVLGRDHPMLWPPRLAWPPTCARWVKYGQPATWTRTPWTAADASWARITPIPCSPRLAWPPTCARWVKYGQPATWTRTPWTAADASWARITPIPCFPRLTWPPTCAPCRRRTVISSRP